MPAYVQLEVNDDVSMYPLMVHTDGASALQYLDCRRRSIRGNEQLQLSIERRHLNTPAQKTLHQ